MTREEILKNIESCTCGYDRCDGCTLKKVTESTCIDELLTAAARLIESQPEIIRCKECKYHNTDTEYCQNNGALYCVWDNTVKPQNHYCSYAERKRENEKH